MYKEQLRAPRVDGQEGGAGLGFLGMARAASAPLEYSLHDIGDEGWFFSLRVLI